MRKVVAPRIPSVSGSRSRASFVFSLGQTSWEAGGADKAPQAGNSPCAVTAPVTRVHKWNYESLQITDDCPVSFPSPPTTDNPDNWSARGTSSP